MLRDSQTQLLLIKMRDHVLAPMQQQQVPGQTGQVQPPVTFSQQQAREIHSNIKRIKEIYDEKYSNQKFNGRDLDALNRMILLDIEIARLLTPDTIVYLFLQLKHRRAGQASNANNTLPENNILAILYHGFKSESAIKLMPNNEPDYNPRAYAEQKTKFLVNTGRIIGNIEQAATRLGINVTEFKRQVSTSSERSEITSSSISDNESCNSSSSSSSSSSSFNSSFTSFNSRQEIEDDNNSHSNSTETREDLLPLLESVSGAIERVKQKNKNHKLLRVPGYSANEIRNQSILRFKKICEKLNLNVQHIGNRLIITNKDGRAAPVTLESFATNFVSNDSLLLDGFISHYFYDPVHLEACLEQDIEIVFPDSRDALKLKDVISAMIANCTNHPTAHEQFKLRLNLIEMHLKEVFPWSFEPDEKLSFIQFQLKELINEFALDLENAKWLNLPSTEIRKLEEMKSDLENALQNYNPNEQPTIKFLDTTKDSRVRFLLALYQPPSQSTQAPDVPEKAKKDIKELLIALFNPKIKVHFIKNVFNEIEIHTSEQLTEYTKYRSYNLTQLLKKRLPLSNLDLPPDILEKYYDLATCENGALKKTTDVVNPDNRVFEQIFKEDFLNEMKLLMSDQLNLERINHASLRQRFSEMIVSILLCKSKNYSLLGYNEPAIKELIYNNINLATHELDIITKLFELHLKNSLSREEKNSIKQVRSILADVSGLFRSGDLSIHRLDELKWVLSYYIDVFKNKPEAEMTKNLLTAAFYRVNTAINLMIEHHSQTSEIGARKKPSEKSEDIPDSAPQNSNTDEMGIKSESPLLFNPDKNPSPNTIELIKLNLLLKEYLNAIKMNEAYAKKYTIEDGGKAYVKSYTEIIQELINTLAVKEEEPYVRLLKYNTLVTKYRNIIGDDINNYQIFKKYKSSTEQYKTDLEKRYQDTITSDKITALGRLSNTFRGEKTTFTDKCIKYHQILNSVKETLIKRADSLLMTFVKGLGVTAATIFGLGVGGYFAYHSLFGDYATRGNIYCKRAATLSKTKGLPRND